MFTYHTDVLWIDLTFCLDYYHAMKKKRVLCHGAKYLGCY